MLTPLHFGIVDPRLVKTFTITTLGIGQNLIFEFREETVSDTGHKLQQ